MKYAPAFNSREEQEQAVTQLIGSIGHGGDRPYNPKTFLRCPFRGEVAWHEIPYDRAREQVATAHQERTIRRELQQESIRSEAEIVLLAALLFYNETPVLQHPVGLYDLDFYIADYGAAIEVDGRQWHNPKRDQKRDLRVLELAGISTYRVPARDVFHDPLWAARYTCQRIVRDRRGKAA